MVTCVTQNLNNYLGREQMNEEYVLLITAENPHSDS